jgi:molybdenum cofactor cytidylyltransferase
VQPATVKKVLSEATRTGRVVSPRYRGRRGHPVAFPLRLRDGILKADAASTLNDALKETGASLEVDVEDQGIRRDVDLPSDIKP